MTRPDQKSYRLMTADGTLGRSKRINPLPGWKRCFDLLGASFGIVILSPVLLLIACYIKLTSRGSILFKHKRYGYLGKPLYVWKFRSMRTTVDPSDHQRHVLTMVKGDSELKKMDNDVQLIPLGKWLRCTAIDELPQLFNVLKGEMSLVGPRPDVVPFEEYQDWQQKRFEVLPGLTGLWQVGGKNHTTFVEMNRLDVMYVERRSFWLDLKIVILTVPAILKLIVEDHFSMKLKRTTKTSTINFERDQNDSTG